MFPDFNRPNRPIVPSGIPRSRSTEAPSIWGDDTPAESWLLPAGTFISTKDAENSVENPSRARGLPMKWESGKPLTFGVNHLKNLRVGTCGNCLLKAGLVSGDHSGSNSANDGRLFAVEQNATVATPRAGSNWLESKSDIHQSWQPRARGGVRTRHFSGTARHFCRFLMIFARPSRSKHVAGHSTVGHDVSSLGMPSTLCEIPKPPTTHTPLLYLSLFSFVQTSDIPETTEQLQKLY